MTIVMEQEAVSAAMGPATEVVRIGDSVLMAVSEAFFQLRDFLKDRG